MVKIQVATKIFNENFSGKLLLEISLISEGLQYHTLNIDDKEVTVHTTVHHTVLSHYSISYSLASLRGKEK